MIIILLLILLITVNQAINPTDVVFKSIVHRPVDLLSRVDPRLVDGSFTIIHDRVPFPQCLQTSRAAELLAPTSIETLLFIKMKQEDNKLKAGSSHFSRLDKNDLLNFEALQLRSNLLNGALVARAATNVADHILEELRCQTTAANSQQLQDFLNSIHLPPSICAFALSPNCTGKTTYRTMSGVCNNLQHPYEGSSQTTFARILPAAYENGISLPRSRSVFGNLLPSCREISLTMGSQPVFDVSFNSFFVTYGQFLIHDLASSTLITDSGRTPNTTCTCDSQDSTLCHIIQIPQNDPFMNSQKCMTVSAVTEGFSGGQCTLGVKNQLNSNSHYIDLSPTYASTKLASTQLRLGQDGLMKRMRKAWTKLDMPPVDHNNETCIDSTSTQKCFASGDLRIMENLVLSGVHAQWLRMHNYFANQLELVRPDWRGDDDILYEETRSILIALHQRYTYEEWLPILIGRQRALLFFDITQWPSQYDPSVPGVVFNEVVTAALRLHTLVRDIYTRSKPDGTLIDQIHLQAISNKCKFAYDTSNRGVDAFLVGSLYDFGLAGDTNYVDTMHHHLFETEDKDDTNRQDIVSINICRGREHGLAGYNAYRQLCHLPRANRFEDLADTMSSQAWQKLQSIYNHPDDIDLFVGINHEIAISGALVGPVSACLIILQFQHLKYGDRFFYTHQNRFTSEQFQAIQQYNLNCFICHSTDVDRVPQNPFRPPHEQINPIKSCNECRPFNFQPWSLSK